MDNILVGDIGGTNARFAFFVPSSQTITNIKKYPTKSHVNIRDLINLYLSEFKTDKLKRVVLSIAGIVEEDRVFMTNADLIVEKSDVINVTKCDDVTLLNDFEGASWGILGLNEHDLLSLNGLIPNKTGTRAILGAGTGLGEAIITEFFGKIKVLPTEGGHCDISIKNELEFKLYNYLKNHFEHVSMEHVLSGKGILRIYEFLCNVNHIKKEENITPETITNYAMQRENSIFEDTMRIFTGFYGREASNLALKCLPKAGVFIVGNIAMKIHTHLVKWGFLDSFYDKGIMADLLKKIPVAVVLRDDLGLLGSGIFTLYN